MSRKDQMSAQGQTRRTTDREAVTANKDFRSKQRNAVKKVDADESTSEEFGRINNVNIINGPQPFLHRFYINGSEVVLEIDSGAAASLLSETCFNKFGVLLSEASMQLHSYGSVAIPVLGEAKLDVVYGPKRVMHNFS